MNSNIKNNTLIGESSAVREEVEARIKYIEKHTDFWRNAQKIAEKYYNKKYKKISFALDDEILLSTKNLAVRKLYKKILNRYVGSFQIFKKIGMNTYQLNLFKKYGRLHRTFYISLFELYTRRLDVASTKSINVNGENQYVVKAILDFREKREKE
jgi:3-hydroxy-3-methylglutaryl CoA synthase